MRGGERGKLLVSALAVFAVFVLCVAYVINVVLQTPLTSRPKNVHVDLVATGGLFVGSQVTYRGVRVGKVTKIGFTTTGVQANAELTTSLHIPASTRAVVRSLSPVGEQYLDLQPTTTKGPYLENGSTISASSTDIPKTLAATVIAINKLLAQVNAKQLHTILDESATALSGTGADLGRLTDQTSALVADLNRYWPQTRQLLQSSSTLLDIGDQNAARIRQTARDTKSFTAFLKSYQPELASTLRTAPHDIAQLHAILVDTEKVLPGFLQEGVSMTDLIVSYDPHLRALLADFAPGLAVLGVAVKNGSLQLDAIGQMDHLCDYHVPHESPTSTTRRPLVTTSHCPGSFPWLQRGAAHAPGPVK